MRFVQHGIDQQPAISVTQTGLSISSSAYKIVENSDQYWPTHITTKSVVAKTAIIAHKLFVGGVLLVCNTIIKGRSMKNQRDDNFMHFP